MIPKPCEDVLGAQLEEGRTLKPCPFCGPDNAIYVGLKGTQAELGCDDCGCHRTLQISDLMTWVERDSERLAAPHYCYSLAYRRRAAEELIKRWNTRGGDDSE